MPWNAAVVVPRWCLETVATPGNGFTGRETSGHSMRMECILKTLSRVKCPSCGQAFDTSKPDSGNFELQGRSGSKAIIRCDDCGNGMLVGLMGRAKAIPDSEWADHQTYMWDNFDSPEAKARSAARIDEIVGRINQESTPPD